MSRCRWKRLRQHSGNFFDVEDAMRRQTRGQMHRSPVGHRRQQISKFLMLSLAQRAGSLISVRCGNVADSRRVPPRPSTHGACLTSTTHLPLPLHSTSISQKREESTPPRNSSLSPSLSLCPVAQSECGGRIVRAHLSTPPSLPLSDPFGKNARARVRLLLTLAQD